MRPDCDVSDIVSADERSDGRTDERALRAVVSEIGEFFWRNRLYVARDLAVALLWVLVLTTVFVLVSLPGWLYYVLLFGGLLCYSLAVSVLGAAAKLER